MTTTVIKDNGQRKLPFDPNRLGSFLDLQAKGLQIDPQTYQMYRTGVLQEVQLRPEIDFKEINHIAIQNALQLVDDVVDEDTGTIDFDLLGNQDFQMLAKRILLNSLYKRAAKNRSYDPDIAYGDFYGLIVSLAEKGLYHKNLLEDYTREELQEAGAYIKAERDDILTYGALHHMSNRYIVRDKDESRSIYELPQERFMIIALATSRLDTPEFRMKQVKALYDVYSKGQLTPATPTYSNAGLPDGQLSSCFILTTDDSLRSIYDDNTDAATLSKNGGGIGVYYGKVRGAGSDIRGNIGVSGGVVPWVKQLNNTAVSVDQLGQRKGAIAVYLDAWHSDIVPFSELRLNTGDLALRAHEIFTGICIPDEFMRQVEARGDWYLFDPHEVKTKMGFSLEDFFDAKKLRKGEIPNPTDHAWTYHYYLCVDNNSLRSRKRMPAIDLMKKIMISQLETGVPFMFYRDTVNRENPNKHAGMIYSSNLCTEIMQNMSPTGAVQTEIDWENGKVIISKSIGDFVTCNLTSLVLNNIIHEATFSQETLKAIRDVVFTAVRATDNVITVNTLPVEQAVYTNHKYRAIGVGEQGIAALLAKLQIPFNSQRAVDFVSELEEVIMLYTIEASAELAKEKGSYPAFPGSEWESGEWIKSRPISDKYQEQWNKVIDKSTAGMRNAWLRANAPTGSTSILAGSSAATEPVYDIIYQDGKKDALLPIVMPHLSVETYYFYIPTMNIQYEGTYDLGQMWTILHHEVRQPWVDQASSHNLYVPETVKASHLLRLHSEVWERGIKTSYYVRSTRPEDGCLGCSA